VPIQSVTTREDTSAKKDSIAKKEGITDEVKEIVFVLSNGKVKAVTVTTGIQDDEYIEIKSGLTGDEEVITGPYSAISRTLKNGDAVEKVRKEDLFDSDKKK
jgi:HlyD family secretion protein